MPARILIFLCLLLTFGAHAQEFNCQVQINAASVNGSEKTVFRTLQTALYEFVNNRKWTNGVLKPEERLEATILIDIRDWPSTDQFKGTISVALKRPVYRASYTTSMLNFQDKDFSFKYAEFDPLTYNDGSFDSNLTSVVAFYLYVMLGLDADSFSDLGGSIYYQKAYAIVNAAQGASEYAGWRSFESMRNRYWLIENLTNSSYVGLRKGIYQYHRLGLDVMSENMETGRTAIGECIENWEKVNREKPGLFAMQLMLEAKRDELVNIYSQASPMDKTKAVNTLKVIDPAGFSKYKQLESGGGR